MIRLIPVAVSQNSKKSGCNEHIFLDTALLDRHFRCLRFPRWQVEETKELYQYLIGFFLLVPIGEIKDVSNGLEQAFVTYWLFDVVVNNRERQSPESLIFRLH
jgi:hypothetical protein